VLESAAQEERLGDTVTCFMLPTCGQVFRANGMEGMRDLGLQIKDSPAAEWVVNCKHVTVGDKVLLYLVALFVRGVST